MDNINESNSKFSYEELLEQNTRLKNQVQEIQRISKKVEDKYQRIIESSPLGMLLYTLTEEDRLIFNGYNKSAERILGVELESLIGKTIEEAFPPLAQTEIPFEYKKTAKTGEEFFTNQVDYDFDKIKGAYEVRAYQVSKNNIAVNFSDISERLKREVELEESQQKFKSLFDNIDEGVALHKMIFDEDNNPIDFVWLDVNPTYEKLTRLKKKDLIGKKSKDVIPNIEQKWYDLYAEVVRTGIPKTLTDYSEYLDKCWEVKAFRPQEGYFAIAMTDVTEKVIGEKKLKESEEQYKILFENIIDEVHYWKVIKDKNGKIITWVLVDANKSALKAWSKTKEQVIGKTANEIFNSDAQKLFMPIVKKIFKTGKSFSLETYFPATKQYLSLDSIPLGEFFISTGRDITIRKKEEQELIKAKEIAQFNERELNKVQEITRIGSWYLDVATNEVVWTKELYKMYGFDESQPIPPYTEHMKLFTAESWELLSESLEQTRKSGIPYELELRTIKKDGSNGWMWVRGEAIQKNGVTVKLWGAAQDITERKHAEKSLRSSQEMLLSSQSLANICSYSTDLIETEIDKSQWECSPEFNKIFGIDETYPHTIEGWIGFLHPDYREEVAAYHESVVLEKKSFNREYKIIRINDGVERWVHGTGELVYDEKGNPIRMYGAIQDITERKQAELALKESENKFKTLFKDNNSIQLLIAPSTGNIIDANQAACDFYGYAYEKLTALSIQDINQDSEEEVKREMKRAKEKKRNYFEFAHKLKDGTIREVEVFSNPISIENEQYLISIIHDITTKKKAERELINAKEKAEESERLKSAFLANMSHEIRTPMNGILGFTSLLQKANLSIENQKNYIDIIQKSGGRLLNTVNDIIEISKIESGEIKVTKSEVNIIGHLDTHVAFFTPEVKKKNLDLVVQNNIEGNILTITTDKNKLSSVLSNLIKNAIKYTKEGTIKVGLKIENNQVLFSCQDTGIGIPKSRQEAIFNRFEQADIEDKQVHEGSGLGLAIVKSYVEMLDGKVWVDSEEGKGSIFYVSLPFEHKKKKKQIIPHEAKSSDSVIKNINVLIVEDEEYSSMHLSILIKDKVKSIKTAENGIKAIDACKNDSGIDLILMDIKMPGMNGIEATKKIREFNKDVVIIAQTAYALEGDERKALDAGCDDYISKPIDENILFELINKYF